MYTMGDTHLLSESKHGRSKSDKNLTDKITSTPAATLSPRSEKESSDSSKSAIGDNVIKDTEFDGKELKELHITTHNIDSKSDEISNTPVVKIASEPERPAAGAGGSSTTSRNITRGRRHVRTSLFDNDCDNRYGLPLGPAAGLGPQSLDAGNGTSNFSANEEIYSNKGKRSIKINRHRDMVSVFPSGCMGIISDDKLEEMKNSEQNVAASEQKEENADKKNEEEKSDEKKKETEEEADEKKKDLDDNEEKASTTAEKTDEASIKVEPKKEESKQLDRMDTISDTSGNTLCQRKGRPPSVMQRNPLTGVGYEDQDFIRHSTVKKRDGNPVLGQGYENKDTRTKKIPPGGYSQGLW